MTFAYYNGMKNTQHIVGHINDSTPHLLRLTYDNFGFKVMIKVWMALHSSKTTTYLSLVSK